MLLFHPPYNSLAFNGQWVKLFYHIKLSRTVYRSYSNEIEHRAEIATLFIQSTWKKCFSLKSAVAWSESIAHFCSEWCEIYSFIEHVTQFQKGYRKIRVKSVMVRFHRIHALKFISAHMCKNFVWIIVNIYQRLKLCVKGRESKRKTKARTNKFKKQTETNLKISISFLILAPTLYYIKIDCRRNFFFLFVDTFHFLIILAWAKCVFFPTRSSSVRIFHIALSAIQYREFGCRF